MNPDQPFDWSALPVDPQDPRSVWKQLQGFVESQLRQGVTEDAIHEQLLAAKIPQEYITELILSVRQGQRDQSLPVPELRSGPDDIGRVFDYLAQTTIDRNQRRQDRKERAKKSARIAASEPDPTFSLEGSPSYAQAMVHQIKREERRWWLPWVVLGLMCLPLLLILAGCILSSLKW